MRQVHMRAASASLLLVAILFGFDASTACAQEPETGADGPKTAARVVAEKLDEFGRIGHCDLTARLDNLAVQLQSEPNTRAYVISYSAPEKSGYAAWQIKQARYYLVHQRGIDAARVIVIDGGRRASGDEATELWIVPPGAVPPVAPPDEDAHGIKDFSGKFDTYATDENIYREIVEMGYTSGDISFTEFADKLKAQPDSVGYLVVHASKSAPPGTWRRVARRDEGILRKDYGLDATRLKSLDGGRSGSGQTEVDLWILPQHSPPPASTPEEAETKQSAAFKLGTYDSYSASDEDAEQWLLENLADALRNDPLARGYIIVREPAEIEVPEGEGDTANDPAEKAQAPETMLMAQSGQASEAVSPAAVSVAGASVTEEASAPEAEVVELSPMEVAEGWKKTLSEKYGIAARRILVLQGRRMLWSNSRTTTWVVPEKAHPPDPLARDADEAEDDVP